MNNQGRSSFNHSGLNRSRFHSPRWLLILAIALVISATGGTWLAGGGESGARAATAPPSFSDEFILLQQQVAALQTEVAALQAQAVCSSTKSCNGTCTDVSKDPNNCGACGTVCAGSNANEVCSSGTCSVTTCRAGYADCNNNPADGCEVSIATDPNNCGNCGNICSLANATAGCTNGTCTVASCNAGYGNCDGIAANGCETNLNTSPQNCGNCGNICSLANATAGCTNGTCTVATCNAGYGNCDGIAANGCETNTQTSPQNCGVCGNICSVANGTAGCAGGACTVASCNAGYANCDGNAANGCETNTQTSSTNCGSCGHACTLGQNCVSGICKFSLNVVRPSLRSVDSTDE